MERLFEVSIPDIPSSLANRPFFRRLMGAPTHGEERFQIRS
jgi:hypothetical protein